MKSGRSSNGKGHFWIIHPANLEDFSRGDFRRRRAQRRVRRSLGLTLPEEDAEDEEESQLLTPPSSLSPVHQTKNYKTGDSTTENNTSSARSDYIQGSYKRRFEDSDNNSDGSSTNKKVCVNKQQDQAYSCASNKHNDHGHGTNNDSAGNNNESVSTDSDHNDNSDCADGNNGFCNRLDMYYALKLAESTKQAEEVNGSGKAGRKRSFNVDSLLAPEGSTKRARVAVEDEECLSDAGSCDDLVEVKKALGDSPSEGELEGTAARSKAQLSLLGELKRVKMVNRSSDENMNSPFSKVESQDVDVEKWKQTFSKIMARSYKNNNSSGGSGNGSSSSSTSSQN